MTDLEQAEATLAEALGRLRTAEADAAAPLAALSDGDHTVTAEALAAANAEAQRTRLLAEAAARNLRAVEDAQPLPSNPAVTISPDITRQREKLAKPLAKARTEAETASTNAARMEASAASARAKADAAVAELTALEAQAPVMPSLGLKVANRLVDLFGVNIEVTTTDEPVTVRRGELPAVRIVESISDPQVLSFDWLARNESELPPDRDAVELALRLAGWRVIEGGRSNPRWLSVPSYQADTCRMRLTLAIEGRRVEASFPDGMAALSSQPKEARDSAISAFRFVTSNVAGALGDGVRIYAGRLDTVALSTETDDDGLTRQVVGARMSFGLPHGEPMPRVARAKGVMADQWARLVGATDWKLGVVTAVEPLAERPGWASRLPEEGSAVSYYATLETAYRPPAVAA